MKAIEENIRGIGNVVIASGDEVPNFEPAVGKKLVITGLLNHKPFLVFADPSKKYDYSKLNIIADWVKNKIDVGAMNIPFKC